MKLDYIPDGAEHCPLVRLYDFNGKEAAEFRSLLKEARDDRSADIKVHEQIDVEPMNDCQLTLKTGARNLGIVQTGPSAFDCILKTEAWDDMASLVEPFCSPACQGYQWLDERGRISLLFSRNGQW
jgi:hypothetical protein